MRLLATAIAWLLALLFALATIALHFMGGAVQSVLMGLAALIALPPAPAILRRATGLRLFAWLRGLAVVLLLAAVVAWTALHPAASIYKSPEIEAQFHRLYERKLAEWPVARQSVFVDTDYGQIHVIVAGPADAPPALLLNASGLAGWSWIHNVEALSRNRRIYAVDNIGEVGLNDMRDPAKVPRTGPQIAAYYASIMDALGIARADVIGASIGGYIATTLAIEMPDRVRSLVLLCPMGYGSTGRTVALMVLTQAFPLPALQDFAFRWALGDGPATRESFGEWFRLVVGGSAPNPIPPHSFSRDELARVAAPTLAFFGTKDDVVGNVAAAWSLAAAIPDVEIVVVDSGHMVGAEKALLVNETTVEFLDR